MSALLLTQLAAAQNRQGGDASIQGSVLSIDNQPANDARVELRDLGTGRTVASAYTNSVGQFEFGGLASGYYEVIATHGLHEIRDRVHVSGLGNFLALRLPHTQAGSEVAPATGSGTVSVAQFQVPRKARRAYDRALREVQRRNLEQAERHLDEALTEHPEFAEALTMRAIMKMDANEMEQALEFAEKSIEADSNYALGYIVRGSALNALGRHEEALQALDRGTAMAPMSWQAFMEMGKALIATQDYRRALVQIDKGAALGPRDNSLANLLRAHALLGMERYAEAMYELQAYLTRNPEGADAAAAQNTLDQVKAFISSRR